MVKTRAFEIGYKGTTVYVVNGIKLDRRDLIYHILCWVRDNNQSGYPQEKFLEFVKDISKQGYSSEENVTIEEAKNLCKKLETEYFCHTRKLTLEVIDFI